jgi:hypothetical protein
MVDIKGPAIASDAFRVEGHCCGIRIPALMDPNSEGVKFEISPELRAELLKVGIYPDEGTQRLTHNDEPSKAQTSPP